jgi:NADH-quinone oxidoreductase subunit L
MNHLLIYSILVPIIGLLVSAFPTNKQEKFIFWTAILTIGVHLLGAFAFTAFWATNGFQPIFSKGFSLYNSEHSEFSIAFYFDKVTFVYGMVSSAITFLVAIFSRYYMHREKGFKRFFNNLLLFYLGLNWILFAGNFETLFIGWEIIGVASFFLIAFYRDRYLPVKNALKVMSLYRLADIFLLIGIWLCHHYFEKSITFFDLFNLQNQQSPILESGAFQWAIPLTFLVVAAVKSAQLPFSSWLPRAMEGPTTSSAVFYGSLSVHIGVFLLLRTLPFWEHNVGFQAIVVVLGLFTSIVATSISRVQSSVKTQLAYSSIAQIGLMFMEVGFGFETLALVHFAGNAFLRTYQLLVSPSVLNYLIHDQFFNFVAPQYNAKTGFLGKMKHSLYILSIKEWNLDSFMYRFLWMPLKSCGQILNFVKPNTVVYFFLPVYILGLYFVYHKDYITANVTTLLPEFFAFSALIMALRVFVERESAKTAWWLVILTHLFLSLSIAFNEQFVFEQIHLYLSGVIFFGVIGYLCLRKLTQENESVSLNQFHGHSYERPRLTTAFLVACLGLAGFPISPTFIGEDLLLGHIHQNQYFLTVTIALGLILVGLSVFRLYARVFLGPHDKGYHEVAYRSS